MAQPMTLSHDEQAAATRRHNIQRADAAQARAEAHAAADTTHYPRVKRVRVANAGSGCTHRYECKTCGDTGWLTSHEKATAEAAEHQRTGIHAQHG